MAKFELKFLDCLDINNLDNIKISVYKPSNEINYIKIISTEFKDNEEVTTGIYLDKSTAIKLAKTLRTEINKITESEVNND